MTADGAAAPAQRRDVARRALELLWEPADGAVFEIRALLADDRDRFGYFDSIDAAIAALPGIDRVAKATYVTLNPVHESLLARAANRLRPTRKGELTGDAHIVRRARLLIDIDAARVAHISSSNAEHAAAIQLVTEIRAELIGMGWPPGLLGDSGNGGHLIHAIDLPNDDDLVERFLAGANRRWGRTVGDIALKIDEQNKNASRLTKLYGTWCRKGDDIPARPHRVATIIDAPERLDVVPRELLEAIAARAAAPKAAPKAATSETRSSGGRGTGSARTSADQVRELIAKHSIGHRGPERFVHPKAGAGDVWILDACPFNADHASGEVHLQAIDGGPPGFACKHASCAGRGWTELVKHFEPDYVPYAQRQQQSTEGRPRIVVSSKIERVVDEAEDALRTEGMVYQRGGTLVHIVRGDSPMKWLRIADGTPMIRKAEAEWLWERASAAATWIAVRKTKTGTEESEVQPPPWVPKVLRARGEWPFPTLDGCCDMPVLRPDGSIHDRAGYDGGSRVFYAPAQRWPAIKSDPTQQDARAALIELIEPFDDFMFVAESDRYAAIAFVLSVIARAAIDGPVPAFKFGATTPGSGKGLCADVGAIIATSAETAKMTHTTNEEETRKRALAIALSAPAVVMVDNIEGSFGGATWAMVLTAGVITDRLLGASEDRTVPVRSVIALTGNNIQFIGDTGRRVIPIDLDPKCEHPQDRTGFAHPDLKAYVSANRVRLASAALTLLRAYFVAGQPAHGKPLYGSFDRWDRVVRGAIIWAGGADVLEGVTRMRAEGQDSDASRLRALAVAWFQAVRDKPVTCAELLGTAAMSQELRDAIDAFGIKGEPMTSRLLAQRLKLYRGRIVGGICLEHAGVSHGGSQRWQVAHAVPAARAAGEAA